MCMTGLVSSAVATDEPVAGFIADTTSGPAPLYVQFTDASTGTVTSYAWDFGDGNTSTEQNPSHTYLTAGNYTVNLTVTGPGGSDTEVKMNFITVSPAGGEFKKWTFESGTVEEFTGVGTWGNGMEVSVSPTAHTGAYSLQCYANNGIGYAKAPLENVPEASTYKVEYWIRSSNIGYGYTDTGISIVDASGAMIAGIGGNDYIFTDTENTYICDRPAGVWVHHIIEWDRDTGVIDHFIYDSNGTLLGSRQITLAASVGKIPAEIRCRVRGYSVAHTIQYDDITVSSGTPSANFSASPTSGIVPLSVQFTDASHGNPTSWVWDFGDNTTSTEQNPVHTYEKDGKYTVNLTVSNSYGSSNLAKTDYITVRSGIPVGNFAANVTRGKSPLSVQFTDLSTDLPTSWLWDFGDNTTSTEQNPVHTYAEDGKYTVSLTVSNSYGSNARVKTNYILVSVTKLAGTPWPKFQADSYNTGQSPYAGPGDNITVWNYTTGGGIQYSGPSIGADGTIYVGSRDNKIYALNPDGTPKWNYTTGGYVYGSPAIASDGTIYIGSYDKNIYALNPDGTVKWSYTTGGYIYGSPVIDVDGTIYIGSYDKNIYALNPDGTLKWKYTTGNYIYYSTPAIGSDGTIYFGSYDGKLYALNPDGTLKWSYTTGARIYGAPAIGSDGTIYFGSYDKNVYALNPDGTLKWSYTTGNYIYGSPAIGSDGTIYIGGYDGKLYALNPDGTLKWSYTTGARIYGAPAIGSDGTIYFGSYDKNVYALNSDGTLKWNYLTGNYIYGSPAIAADGTLYIGSYDGKLYAFSDPSIAPVASFTADVTSGFEPLTVQFRDTSNSHPSSWLWDFGDGTTSTEKNPSHTYATPGSYSVNLTVTNAIGSNSTVQNNYITVSKLEAPVANFTLSKTSGDAPLAVVFTDASSGFVATWAWDFNNDGVTDSAVKNPSYTYNTPGNYTVTLTVSNAKGNSTKTDSIVVTTPALPVADFNATPTSGDIPLNVQFTDQSTGVITSRAWDFNNDGTVDSTLQNPSYNYTTAGNFTVNLTVTNAAGSVNKIKTDYISVAAVAAPVAEFSAFPTSGYSPLTVMFNDTSTGSITSYAWDFNNDGTIDSTMKNATYTYTKGGTYTVNHTVTGWGGTSSSVKSDLISVTSVSDLQVSSISTLYPYDYNTVTATIKNSGTGDSGAFKANFTVDGNTTTINVTELAAGSTTTISVTDQVHRKSGDTVPIAIMLDTENAVNETNETNNEYSTTATVAARDSWYGGRYAYGTDLETTYSAEGNIGVVLSNGGTTYYAGNPTYTADELGIPANATIKTARMYLAWTWYGYTPYTVSFNGHSIDAPTVHYTDGNDGQDMYDVTEYFVPGANNTATITGGNFASYGRTLVVVYEDPSQPYRKIYLNEGYDIIYYSEGYAMFRGINTTGMGSAKVITVTPSGSGDTGAIGFNGQSISLGSSGGSDPNFNYYDVTGAIQNGTNELRADRASYYSLSNAILSITQAEEPVAAFTSNVTSGSAPLTVKFTDASTGSPTSWAWDFDNDGKIDSTEQNPSYTYESAGTYTVTLTATNDLGSDTVTVNDSIIVTPATGAPVAGFNATPTSGTFPLTVAFTDESTNTPTSWAWDFDNDGTVDSTDQNPSHIYDSAGTYTVTLTATNEHGSDSEMKTGYITVNTISADSLPLITEQNGTVSGDLYVGSFQPVPFADQPTSATVRDFDQSFNIPAFTNVQWAKLYVNVYSGSGSANWPARTTITLDGNGDGTYETILGVENMDTESYSADGTVYWLNDHMNRVYSDYETDYNVTDLITSTTPTVHIKVEKTGANFDGRLKAVTLVVAYNDGDSDSVKYWVNHGHDWINEGSSSTKFATSGLATGFTNATLSNVALSSYDAGYTFNGVTQEGADPVAPIKYYENHTWSVTDALTAGSDSTFKYALKSGSFKTTLATLTVKYPASTPAAPLANFSANVTSGTTPLVVQFTDTSTNTPTSWLWDFGDGETSTEQSPIHTYSMAGNYSVKLTVTNARGSDDELKADYITVTSAAGASLPWQDPCESLDGWTCTYCGLNDKTVYEGNYSIGCDPSQFTSGYNIYTSAERTINIPAGAKTLRFDALSLSTNYVYNSWVKVFLDGNEKVSLPVILNNKNWKRYEIDLTGIEPGEHTFKIGSYMDSWWGNAGFYIDNIWVIPDEEVLSNVNVSPSEAELQVGDNITFSAQASTQYGERLTDAVFTWSSSDDSVGKVNDGGIFTALSAGNVTVNATADGVTGSATVYVASPVLPAPVAAFTANVTSGEAPLTVQFTDESTNSPTSWKWDFGDGTNSTEQNVSHTYTSAGNYTVNLTVSNADGSDFEVKTEYIIVSEPLLGAPVANFTANRTSGKAPLDVQFTDASTGNVSSYSWDFDNDGTVDSTEQNPIYTYSAAGTYTVNLTVSNEDGNDSEVKTGYIKVSSPSSAKPVAAFSASPTSGKTPLKVAFTDTSTGSPTSWFWKFGDGSKSYLQNPTHKYSKAGTYTVNLTVKNAKGSNTVTKTDYIKVITKPVANFTSSVTSGKVPLKVAFTDTSTGIPAKWIWDFGDGSKSYLQNPTHKYSKAGIYTVNLTVKNAKGSNMVTKTDYIKVITKPVANFSANPTSGKTPLKVTFTDTSTGIPAKWIWDFGDGSKSFHQNPIHKYSKAGTYTVNLTVKNAKGSNTATKTDYIKVI